MDKIQEELRSRIQAVCTIKISVEHIRTIIKRRKNWTAPGIDGIQNFYWKKFSTTWKALERMTIRWISDPESILLWLTLGRMVLLPKVEELLKSIIDQLHA